MNEHRAPWCRTLVLMSVLVTALCGGLSAWLAFGPQYVPAWVPALPVAILAGGALFIVRGYAIAPDGLLIRRLLWTTRLPLAGIESARHDPQAMRGSLRLFANGGLYSFSGWFRSRSLGTYRAFVTDPSRAIVLRVSGKHVLVSPGEPARFLRELAVLHPAVADRA